MKKLLLSAFAVSLILASSMGMAQTATDEDLLAKELVLPELVGKQRFTTESLHKNEEWKVKADTVAKDVSEPVKGQSYSMIPWSTLDPIDYLNVTTWLIERKHKDETADWKIRLRSVEHKELVAKVLQCKGECSVFRGVNKASVQHLSRILEGDELRVEKNSVAWIYMMDGSLMRVSSESAVSFQEINFKNNEVFALVRLNQGHVFWHPREKSAFEINTLAETDSLSLPLMIRESNQAFFERKIFQKQTDSEHLTEILDLDELSAKDQISKLNEMRKENDPKMTSSTKVMIVSPNSTLVARETSFDFVFVPGEKSYFKKRTTRLGEEFSLYLRGYSDTEVKNISEMSWHEVSVNGRAVEPMANVPGHLQVLELLTKRIKTIELAREFWVRDFSAPVFEHVNQAEVLGRKYGYYLWGDDYEKRINFLAEYTRRIETTNLRSLENLLVKLETNGEKPRKELSLDMYQASLNHYLLGLKSRYDSKKMQVREMNDLQYYIWILKDGKF